MISVVDIGMGNLRSVIKAFARIGVDAELVSSPAGVAVADKLVLPGVGHFGEGMKRLTAGGFVPVLCQRVLDDRVPILGICLGMQMLTRYSEEGEAAGLGWIDAQVHRFEGAPEVPKRLHIGWNSIERTRESRLLSGLSDGAEFYFVHACYVAVTGADEAVLTTTEYGLTFCSTLAQANIYGTQFHPEKSHAAGLHILENFAAI